MLANHIESPDNEEILPEDCKDYYLFLLEFFVQQVGGDRLAKLNQMFFIPTSVHFNFLNFVDEDDLQVTPVDPFFEPQAAVSNDVEVFNSGRSVLFAVDHDSATDRTAKMILTITVKKQMPDGIKPDVVVGTGELDLTREYAALRLETLQYWRKGVTISKMFDDQVALKHNDKTSGFMQLYVRISGYGQTILTEFDAPSIKDPLMFSFGAGEIDRTLTYKFRKIECSTIDLTKDSCQTVQGPTCPVCVPERRLCIPCEKVGAIQERDDKAERTMHKWDVSKIGEKKLKDTSSSKNAIRCKSDYETSETCGKPVVLKVSGLFDVGDKKPTVTVSDDTATADPTDPDYDIFVLRIGKKGLVGAGEKSDIQLEMKTPKGPERRPPIRYETRQMQTDLSDIEPMKEKKKKKHSKKHK